VTRTAGQNLLTSSAQALPMRTPEDRQNDHQLQPRVRGEAIIDTWRILSQAFPARGMERWEP